MTDPTTPTRRPSVLSGLSGNEMYCIDLLGYHPGNLLVGNSVFSRGFLGSLSAGFRGMVGGEVTAVVARDQEDGDQVEGGAAVETPPSVPAPPEVPVTGGRGSGRWCGSGPLHDAYPSE